MKMNFKMILLFFSRIELKKSILLKNRFVQTNLGIGQRYQDSYKDESTLRTIKFFEIIHFLSQTNYYFSTLKNMSNLIIMIQFHIF